MRSFLATLLFLTASIFLLPQVQAADDKAFPLEAERILILGDSITHAGGYVAWIETQLRLQQVEPLPQIINIGLASETASGLSEPGHPFPRPDVHERLDRALAKIKPDVVMACYGMNDGIYYPLSEERFQAYREGINRLIEKSHQAGAKVILVTPPPFDPAPLKDSGKLKPAGEDEYAFSGMYENYNDVLTVYAKWIMQQADRVAMVIDINTPLVEYTVEQRKSDPSFTHARDGIHPGAEGHRVMGNAILQAWGITKIREPSPELFKLVNSRSKLLHDAYLTDVGHQRPGVGKGLPLEEALEKADELAEQIEAQIDQP